MARVLAAFGGKPQGVALDDEAALGAAIAAEVEQVDAVQVRLVWSPFGTDADLEVRASGVLLDDPAAVADVAERVAHVAFVHRGPEVKAISVRVVPGRSAPDESATDLRPLQEFVGDGVHVSRGRVVYPPGELRRRFGADGQGAS